MHIKNFLNIIKSPFKYLLIFIILQNFIFCKEIFFWKINTKEKVIFLTFDDGPSEYTHEVLKILEKYNIKATFFVLGELVKFYKSTIIEIVNKGHDLASHTYQHKNFYKLNKTLDVNKCKIILEDELLKTEKEIKNVLKDDFKIKFLRLPNGFYRKWVDEVVSKFDYRVINWTYGCDWLNLDKEEMVNGYVNSLINGGIYLFHDGGKKRQKTLKVLEEFIKISLSKGYRFDTLSNWIK